LGGCNGSIGSSLVASLKPNPVARVLVWVIWFISCGQQLLALKVPSAEFHFCALFHFRKKKT